jgi:hypothetical protein
MGKDGIQCQERNPHVTREIRKEKKTKKRKKKNTLD